MGDPAKALGRREAAMADRRLMELTRLAQQARRDVNARDAALGKALIVAGQLLSPWLRREAARRLGEGAPDVEDLLSDATVRVYKGHLSLTAPRQFLTLLRQVLTGLLVDEQRHRSAARRAGVSVLSLEHDSAAATLALSVDDGQAPVEAVIVDRELHRKISRLVTRLPDGERRVVRLWMKGIGLDEFEQRDGAAAARQWNSALMRLRRGLRDYLAE